MKLDLITAINERRSIRGYKKDPVPKEVIEEILKISTRSTSGNNVQPWEFHVVTGEKLDQLRTENIRNFKSDTGKLVDANYKGIFLQRQVTMAKKLLEVMDIKREDKEKRAEWFMRGFRFFEAPAAIIITAEKEAHYERWAYFDIGGVTQTISLTALNYGLGTCIQLQGAYYQEAVRSIMGIPDNKLIVISISLGYPDMEFAANHVISEREDIANITTWYGF